jgi:hypothetical protein
MTRLAPIAPTRAAAVLDAAAKSFNPTGTSARNATLRHGGAPTQERRRARENRIVFCTLLGGLPLMLRQPLGYVIVGGLALSQVLTLYSTYSQAETCCRIILDPYASSQSEHCEDA